MTHYQRPNITHPQEGGTGGEVSEILFFSAKSKRHPSLIYSMQIIPVCLSIVARRKGVPATRRGGLNWTPISLLVGHPCKLFHTYIALIYLEGWQGLSPRLRGNDFAAGVLRKQEGSIPALAGERLYLCALFALFRVYPRACGGTRSRSRSRFILKGLSPRLRGNAIPIILQPDEQGSIPALAGERFQIQIGAIRYGVYPRACGGTMVV